jgi:hypothetical protein
MNLNVNNIANRNDEKDESMTESLSESIFDTEREED